MSSNNQLLKGVKVLDLSQYIPGPFATRQLADLGAEVIKIEPPAGDPMRRILYQGPDAVSPIYRHINRGKKIAFVDLKTESGQSTFANLLAEANIFLESFRPGVMDRLGFDKTRMMTINPALVYCALSGYGQTGPYRHRSGHDINYLAASAALSVSGTRDQAVMPFPPIADHAGALQAATTILAALYRQQKEGSGCYLDLSLFEASLSWQYLSCFGDNRHRGEGLLSGGAACYNIYHCADGGQISLGALEPHLWTNFCVAVDKDDWINRQQEQLPQLELIRELQQLFGQGTLAHWTQILDQCDCCFHPLVQPEELAHQIQISARGAFNQHGPGFPGMINDAIVSVESDVTEFESDEIPTWSLS